jgi:hypothetical protein
MIPNEPPPVLVILGSGRSGTTIVLTAVSTLPGVAAVPRLAGRLPTATRVATQLARWGVGPSAWRRPSAESTALFAEAGITQQRHIDRGGGILTSVDVPADRARSLPDRLETIRRIARARTVVIKSTAACGRVPLLAEILPGAVFVHVVRSPSEVVASLLESDFWHGMTLWWDGRTTSAYARELALGDAQVAARHWTRQVAAAAEALHALPPERSITIRYSDFTDDPLAVLSRLRRVGIAEPNPTALSRLDIRVRRNTREVAPEITDAVNLECAGVASRIGVEL